MWKKFKDNFVIIFLTIVSIAALSVSLISAIFEDDLGEHGIVTIQLIDEYGEMVDEIKMEFAQDTQLLELLARHYGESGVHGDYYVAYGILITHVGPLDVRNRNDYYIAISKNGAESFEGVSFIQLKDGMVIEFKMVAIK